MTVIDISDHVYDDDGNVSIDWLYKKYRGICWICKKFIARNNASRDHVKPKSLGGSNEITNIALAHKSCNSKRGNGYREVYFKHCEVLEEAKDVTIMEEHGLVVQFWKDKADGGINILVAKRLEST